jgi:hypothetical protein
MLRLARTVNCYLYNFFTSLVHDIYGLIFLLSSVSHLQSQILAPAPCAVVKSFVCQAVIFNLLSPLTWKLLVVLYTAHGTDVTPTLEIRTDILILSIEGF